MPVVFVGFAFACHAERLAGATPGPDLLVVAPAGEPEAKPPATDPGEEVALPVSAEVVGLNKSDVSLIYVTWRDVACRNEIAEPLRGVWVDFVVVRTDHAPCIVPKTELTRQCAAARIRPPDPSRRTRARAL